MVEEFLLAGLFFSILFLGYMLRMSKKGRINQSSHYEERVRERREQRRRARSRRREEAEMLKKKENTEERY